MRSPDTNARLLAAGPAVVLGDFNSGTTLTPPRNITKGHERLVARLEREFNLVSAYHHKYRAAHGEEPHPTYFYLRRQHDPWHIDFCFVPKEWVDRIEKFFVGDYDSWSSLSDHRSVTITLQQGRNHRQPEWQRACTESQIARLASTSG